MASLSQVLSAETLMLKTSPVELRTQGARPSFDRRFVALVDSNLQLLRKLCLKLNTLSAR